MAKPAGVWRPNLQGFGGHTSRGLVAIPVGVWWPNLQGFGGHTSRGLVAIPAGVWSHTCWGGHTCRGLVAISAGVAGTTYYSMTEIGWFNQIATRLITEKIKHNRLQDARLVTAWQLWELSVGGWQLQGEFMPRHVLHLFQVVEFN